MIAPASDLARSNSLVDLAARIKAEHEATTSTLKRGLEHALAAGKLLIEAKEQLAHGQWLPWLKEHCGVPERTAQAYMRVARSFGTLDDAKAQRVADLSFRDALNSLAATGLVLRQLPPASYARVLKGVEDHENGETWRNAVRRVRYEDKRSHYSLETPQSMLPSPAGRKIRVARNAAKRQWMLAVGPNISSAKLMKKEQAARETSVVQELQLEHTELLERAAALEAEAKALREDAQSVQTAIRGEIKQAVGPMLPLTETYDFQADEQTDAELALLPQEELVDRLLAARGSVSNGLEEGDRGYWGDMDLTGWWVEQINAAPGGGSGRGWSRVGSPEWLEEVFPGWDESSEERHDAPRGEWGAV
jgi:hypothetical protein